MPSEIRSDKGTYALGLSLDRARLLIVGRLGRFIFPAGYYLYSGSALGPGGLPARLARHGRREKHLHWHIDYLLEQARLVETWTTLSARRWECVWARALLQMAGAQIVAPRFGASDCRCPTHLIYLSQSPGEMHITAALQASVGKGMHVQHQPHLPHDADHWFERLLQGDEDAREEAAHALGSLGERVVPRLLALLKGENDDVRCWAAWALANTGSPRAIGPLIAALEDAACDVRTCAAMALGELRAPEAAPALVTQLESWHGLLARCAADALEKIGLAAVPALVEALEHPKSQVRTWAARALAHIGSKDAVEALCHVYLYDKSYLAQHYAQEALHDLGLLEMVLIE